MIVNRQTRELQLNLTLVIFIFIFFLIADLKNFSSCNVIQQIKKVWPYGRILWNSYVVCHLVHLPSESVIQPNKYHFLQGHLPERFLSSLNRHLLKIHSKLIIRHITSTKWPSAYYGHFPWCVKGPFKIIYTELCTVGV